MDKIKADIEKAIRETLVVQNKESIYRAVDKIAALSTQSPKWVRCKDRLPEKKTDDLSKDRAVIFINRKESKVYGFYLSIMNNIHTMLIDLIEWEWLDESHTPDPTHQQLMEANQGLREALTQVYDTEDKELINNIVTTALETYKL